MDGRWKKKEDEERRERAIHTHAKYKYIQLYHTKKKKREKAISLEFGVRQFGMSRRLALFSFSRSFAR